MSSDKKWRPGPSVGGSTGRSTTGGNNESDELNILIDVDLSDEENKQLDSLDTALVEEAKAGQPDSAKPKIQRVPFRLRDNINFNNYLKPRVISIGPYHYNDKNLKNGEPIKLKLAALFIKETGVTKEALYLHIKKEIKNLRDCYDNEATKDYQDHELAWIFLVDGCAVLQFMYIISVDEWYSEWKLRELGIKTDYAVYVPHDLFLLDNQLPYQVLQLIMQSTSPSKKVEFMESIHKFIFGYIRIPGERHRNNDQIFEDNPVHLLDILRKMLIQPIHEINKKPNLIIELIIDLAAHLLNKLKCIDKKSEHWHSYRSIEDLREAGINLKPGQTSCVRDITFSLGTLKLPPIVVDGFTAQKFLNMAAYEMCPDFHNGFEVSSYFCFLDSLIDRAQDVKALREMKILYNELGGDEEVARLFNDISTGLVPNKDIYREVKSNIKKYCNTIWLKWLRQVFKDLRDYFKGRWSLIAFIGAFLALASSIIQTVYTVLAYHVDSNKGN